MVGQITLYFPIFLIYPRQTIEDLSHQMDLRATQGHPGIEIWHRTIIGNPQDLLPLLLSLPQLLEQQWRQLLRLGLHQFHRLFDVTLAQQTFHPLTQQVLGGAQTTQSRAIPSSGAG